MTIDRRDAIAAFRAEVERLEVEEVLVLDPPTRARVAAHHDAILQQDPVTPVARAIAGAAGRLSVGMRIATLLGAIALSAAYALFIDSFWATLSLAAQLPLVVFPPLVLAGLTDVAVRREPSRYIASIIACVAVIAFTVNLAVLGSLFNLPDSRHAFLAVGLFAMALAYGYRLSLVLVLGIVGVGLWLWSLASVPSGAWWTTAFEHLEPLAVIGLLAIVFASRLSGPAPFADEYRGLGAIALAAALLILGQTARSSGLPDIEGRVIEGVYQVIGAIAFTLMVVVGVRRGWPELVRVGTGATLVFLFLRLADWFWDWLPKWLFFLLIGVTAVIVVLVLRRIRVAQEGP